MGYFNKYLRYEKQANFLPMLDPKNVSNKIVLWNVAFTSPNSATSNRA
jgi:hypothetical protein